MSHAARTVRQQVAQFRQDSPENAALQPKGGAVEVMKFIAGLSADSAVKPTTALDDLLADRGYAPARGELHENDSGSSSFSFNLDEAQSMMTGTISSFGALRVKAGLSSFSSDLAFRCLPENNPQLANAAGSAGGEEATTRAVVPWEGFAAVMFIDVSGYSKVASALTSQGGAHALSTAVNAYFEAILSIVVDGYNGDVLTFAGDAIVVAWAAPDHPPRACLLACACALDLQRKCGMSPVQGLTDLFFRLHIGITCGSVTSQVFLCPNSRTMQTAFHFTSGDPLSETSEVVDRAGVGEICVTDLVRQHCGGYLQLDSDWTRSDSESLTSSHATPVSTRSKSLFKVKAIDDDYREGLEPKFTANAVNNGSALVSNATVVTKPSSGASSFVGETLNAVRRMPWLENGLVHPSIARKLRQGFKASHVAEMRFLCVLFIRKVIDSIDVADWFGEVQRILDANRCPIVQIIDDDKGTHIIAAVNLFVTERSPAAVGIVAARQLVDRECGCVIGLACGEVFCGVTGSPSACRWDITGPACVRACRLMQHALVRGVSVVADDSVYEHAPDVSQLDVLARDVSVKGSDRPIVVYRLSATSVAASSSIMSGAWSSDKTHPEARAALAASLFEVSPPLQRGAVLITGPVGVGKRMLCLQFSERHGYMTVMHTCSRDHPSLGVVSTLAEWFTYHADPAISGHSKNCLKAFRKGHLTSCLGLALELVSLLISKGIKLSFTVLYAQFIDSASLSFIKGIVTEPPTEGAGRFYVLCTAYPIHNSTTTATDIEHNVNVAIAASNRSVKARRFQRNQTMEKQFSRQSKLAAIAVDYPTNDEEFKKAVEGTSYFLLRPNTANVFRVACGGCYGLIEPLIAALRNRFIEKVSAAEREGKTVSTLEFPAPATIDGTIHVTPAGRDYLYNDINWLRVAPHAAARFTELYDVLPPRLQLLLRVIASASSNGEIMASFAAGIMAKLNARITLELVERDVQYLFDLRILKPAEGGWKICFAVPAMQDVVVSLLTPEQDTMLKRHAAKLAIEWSETKLETMPVTSRPWAMLNVGRAQLAARDHQVYRLCIKRAWRYALEAASEETQNLIQQQISQEYRRNAAILGENLFDEFEAVPMMRQIMTADMRKLSTMEVMPVWMERAKEFYPPMALGAISGEYQKICWFLINEVLDFTKEPGAIFIEEMYRRFLSVNLDHVMTALTKLEGLIGHLPCDPVRTATLMGQPFVPPTNLTEERAFLQRLTQKAPSKEVACLHMQEFICYHDTVILGRRDRMVKHVETLVPPPQAEQQVREQMHVTLEEAEQLLETNEAAIPAALVNMMPHGAKEAMLSHAGPVKKAFRRLARPQPIPATAVHEALLDLATAGWISQYYHISLQAIRDQVLRKRTSTDMDFKAMLYSLLVFGETITEASRPI